MIDSTVDFSTYPSKAATAGPTLMHIVTHCDHKGDVDRK